MKRWFANSLGVLLAVALASAVVSSQGQSSPSAQPGYTAPKTPWGDPDLQGIWPGTDMVGVPFERPERFGTRLYLTDAELQEREQQAKKQEKPISAGGFCGSKSRTSVQPANGRMPAMTPEGTARQR